MAEITAGFARSVTGMDVFRRFARITLVVIASVLELTHCDFLVTPPFAAIRLGKGLVFDRTAGARLKYLFLHNQARDFHLAITRNTAGFRTVYTINI